MSQPLLNLFLAGILGCAAIVAPLCLGATAPAARFGLEGAMALSALAWAFSRTARGWRLAIPLLAAGGCLFQVVPLPDRLLMPLASISGGAWKVALAGDTSAWGCISIDPASTLVGIRRLLLGISTICVVADVARTESARRLLFGAVATSGMAIMLLGAAFPTTKDDRIALGFIDLSGPIWFWKTPVDAPVQTAGFSETDLVDVGTQRYPSDSWIVGDRIGSYIVSNHYAGGVCLTLPFVLGCWLVLSQRKLPIWAVWFGVLLLTAFGIWTVAGVAKSRAGTVSLVLAMLVFVWLAAEARWLRLVAGSLAGVGATLILCGTLAMHGPLHGMTWLIPQPLRATVEVLLRDARVLASKLAGRMFAASPLFGTGLGSYYPLAARMLGSAPPWAFAHNDYAQLLAETGIAGGATVLAGLARLAATGRAFALQPFSLRRRLDAAPWAALAGIAAHSFFDWNLHVPANAFLATLAVGLAMSSVPERKAKPAPAPNRPGLALRAGRVTFVAAIVSSVVLLGRDAQSDRTERMMRAALAEARLAQADKKRPSAASVLTRAIQEGRTAQRWDPADAEIPLLLGQLSLHLAEENPSDAPALLAQADRDFQRARRLSPVCRGLPEPLPPAQARPAR